MRGVSDEAELSLPYHISSFVQSVDISSKPVGEEKIRSEETERERMMNFFASFVFFNGRFKYSSCPD